MSTPTPSAKIPAWIFLDYVESGTNKIEQWLLGRPGVTAGLRSTLAYLGGLRPDQWGKTYPFQWLTKQKKYADAKLGELRFDADGLPQRPAGVFGVKAYQFVLLVGCCKQKGHGYLPSPPHPFDVALERRTLYLANPTSTTEERKLV